MAYRHRQIDSALIQWHTGIIRLTALWSNGIQASSDWQRFYFRVTVPLFITTLPQCSASTCPRPPPSSPMPRNGTVYPHDKSPSHERSRCLWRIMLLVMAGHNASLSLRMEDGGVIVSSELLTQRKLEREMFGCWIWSLTLHKVSKSFFMLQCIAEEERICYLSHTQLYRVYNLQWNVFSFLTHTWSSGGRRCSARGAVGGSVPCSRFSPQSWTIPAGAEIRTHNLGLQVQRSTH